MNKLWPASLVCALFPAVVACASSDDDTPATQVGATGGTSATGDAQNPPTTNGADVEAWLKTGAYKTWKCEVASHPQLKVSPHGKNRVCSNDLAAGFTGAVGTERPIKTASVKELYDDASVLVGYAVAVKTKATSDGGSSWYWYERIGMDTVADGLGSSGTPKSICVGCHVGAGTDAGHAVMGSADYVYLQAGP